MRIADLVAKTLVLVPAGLLVVLGLDLGGLQSPVSQVVVGSAQAVAQPVADELLERLPWPGPPGRAGPTCVFGPHPVGAPCGQAPT